eukprot:5354000-Alexandrium_andersonii.AAC.1
MECLPTIAQPNADQRGCLCTWLELSSPIKGEDTNERRRNPSVKRCQYTHMFDQYDRMLDPVCFCCVA